MGSIVGGSVVVVEPFHGHLITTTYKTTLDAVFGMLTCATIGGEGTSFGDTAHCHALDAVERHLEQLREQIEMHNKSGEEADR